MKTNELPAYDKSDNTTGCCPRFHPEGWNDQTLTFENMPFVRASTISMFHMPLNMSSVFSRTTEAIKKAHAEKNSFLVLSRDDSPWHAEHLFAVDGDVAGAEMVRLNGTFLTKVFEGPFKDAREWCAEMERIVKARGRRMDALYYFYTTCPRCAKAYGHNYVVGFAQLG